MRSLKRPGRSDRIQSSSVDADLVPDGLDADDESDEDSTGTYEIFRVICPDCARAIALLAEEEVLPQHALCPTPWNPFGLEVCPGTGRGVAGTTPADGTPAAQEQDAAMLLTLPEGLDWRRQPFSHVGGPGSRPLRVPARS
ncbi:hypothetical protein ACFYYR_06825 [Streptomyces sp. NPDC001922]|uniref:hypothetical protein n=1 Tax=Streptomyces sp. NPDC001922 TaxID=3364624 RepID=UPI003689E095